MSFAAPAVLLAGVVILALLLVWLRRADRRRRADLARFASDHVLGDLTAGVSVPRRRVKRAMVVGGVGLVLLALAGPEIGHRFEESRRRGIDVLIAVDVSKSMLAGDVVPNRLQRAKLAVADLVGQLGDRVGLIAFAGSAFLQCPLTLDQRAFDESLAVLAPDLIPQPGSNLASAIHVAEEALATEERNVKLLVLFSDGEDLGGDALDAARAAAEQKLRIFTVGVGTPAGELIPVPTEGGGTDFVKDAQGNIVKSRLDEKTLTEVAEATGGFYVALGARGEGVDAIRDRALAPIPKEELAARLRQVPQNRFQWPLLLGIVLLLVEPLVSDRRRTPSGTALAAGLLLALALPASAGAASLAEAKRLYDAGKYAEARDAYNAAHEADPENRDVDFNLGAAAYKAGDFADAAAAFARALQSKEPARQQQSFYNLGNTQFRLGDGARETDPKQTMAAWQQALEAFDQALALNAEDADAKFNRELVAKALEELKQEQQQQQQQQQQDGEQNDEQKDQQQQGQQDQQQQGQQDPQQGQQNQQDQQQQQGQQQDQENQQAKQDEQQGQQDARHDQQPDGEGKRPGEDETPKAAPGTEQAEQKNGEDAAGEPSEAAVPGRMTPTEARALLESLRGEERTLPMLGQAGQTPPPADGTVQDW